MEMDLIEVLTVLEERNENLSPIHIEAFLEKMIADGKTTVSTGSDGYPSYNINIPNSDALKKEWKKFKNSDQSLFSENQTPKVFEKTNEAGIKYVDVSDFIEQLTGKKESDHDTPSTLEINDFLQDRERKGIISYGMDELDDPVVLLHGKTLEDIKNDWNDHKEINELLGVKFELNAPPAPSIEAVEEQLSTLRGQLHDLLQDPPTQQIITPSFSSDISRPYSPALSSRSSSTGSVSTEHSNSSFVPSTTQTSLPSSTSSFQSNQTKPSVSTTTSTKSAIEIDPIDGSYKATIEDEFSQDIARNANDRLKPLIEGLKSAEGNALAYREWSDAIEEARHDINSLVSEHNMAMSNVSSQQNFNEPTAATVPSFPIPKPNTSQSLDPIKSYVVRDQSGSSRKIYQTEDQGELKRFVNQANEQTTQLLESISDPGSAEELQQSKMALEEHYRNIDFIVETHNYEIAHLQRPAQPRRNSAPLPSPAMGSRPNITRVATTPTNQAFMSPTDDFGPDAAALEAAKKLQLRASNGQRQFTGGFEQKEMAESHLNKPMTITPVYKNSKNETVYAVEHPEPSNSQPQKRTGILWKINSVIQKLTGRDFKLGQSTKIDMGQSQSNAPSIKDGLTKPNKRH